METLGRILLTLVRPPQNRFKKTVSRLLLDAAYVFAYAVIMLNTDAHNPQIKAQNRMTKPQFFRNTSGINDGADIPEEVVSGIYDDITNNEIRMKDEVRAALPSTGPGLAGALVNVGRDLQKEAYVVQTNNMANKTEVGSQTQRSGKLSDTDVGVVQITNAIATKRTTRPAVLQRFPLRSRQTNV